VENLFIKGPGKLLATLTTSTISDPNTAVERRKRLEEVKRNTGEFLWFPESGAALAWNDADDCWCDSTLLRSLDWNFEPKRLSQMNWSIAWHILVILASLWQRLHSVEMPRMLDPRRSHCLELLDYFWAIVSRISGI
jgi:hypothetical protein